MLLSKCAVCGKTKSTFTKKEEFYSKIINKVSLTVNKFMLELHLKQPRFSYSACGPFTRHWERIQKFRDR